MGMFLRIHNSAANLTDCFCIFLINNNDYGEFGATDLLLSLDFDSFFSVDGFAIASLWVRNVWKSSKLF